MKSITPTVYSPSYKSSQLNIFTRFIDWSKEQEKNRFGWLAVSLTAQGCIIAPLVLTLVGVTGGNLAFWMTAMISMGMVLIVNLAAMPTKITIPTFALSILIDISVVVGCIVQSVGN